MNKDFYLDERGLAAYFEKDWIDHIDPAALTEAFRFAPFAPAELSSAACHVELAKLVHAAVVASGIAPVSLLEIGASLGRGFFEVSKKLNTLKRAKLVEPSAHLFGGLKSIYQGSDSAKFSVIKGFGEFTQISLATAPMRKQGAGIEFEMLNVPYEELAGAGRTPATHDLVVCSNVIDQCKDPRTLAEVCKSAVAPGGLLALSCTYQWQNKYTGNAVKLIDNIHELFGPGWKFFGEANIPFQVRSNERYWLRFLSHAVVYQNLIPV